MRDLMDGALREVGNPVSNYNAGGLTDVPAEKTRVLIAEDDPQSARGLEEYLQAMNCRISVVNNGLSAIEILRREAFDVLIVNLTLPRVTGAQLLTRIKSQGNGPEVIIMSSPVGIDTAVEVMRLGAVDFLIKPVRPVQLQAALRLAAEKRRRLLEQSPLPHPVRPTQTPAFKVIRCPRMKEIEQIVSKVARSNSTILITGDSGVGKEVIARNIHKESLRFNNSFTDISCAAITETLLESELFGHEKGSFTGADSSKPGLLEIANGGTLFLDEIGEIGPVLQTKLLRVIETRSFYRVGGTKQITVDVRILAATNKDLKQAVEEGKFRKDLYYRLNTIHIEVPPLRERSDDIPELIQQFLEEFDPTHQRRFSEPAVEALQRYPWPGNIRELRNVIERVLLISPQMLLDVDDLPNEILNFQSVLEKTPVHTQTFVDSLSEMEKRQIATVLQKTRWHRGKAAELLEISPKTLYRKIKQYDLDKVSRIS